MKKIFIILFFTALCIAALADDDLPAPFPKISEDAPPVSQIANVLNHLIYIEGNYYASKDTDKFLNDLTAINCSRCPQDFRDAWKKMVNAIIEFRTHNPALAAHLLLDLIFKKTNGITDGLERYADMHAAILELKAVCAQYGVDSSHAIQ